MGVMCLWKKGKKRGQSVALFFVYSNLFTLFDSIIYEVADTTCLWRNYGDLQGSLSDPRRIREIVCREDEQDLVVLATSDHRPQLKAVLDSRLGQNYTCPSICY